MGLYFLLALTLSFSVCFTNGFDLRAIGQTYFIYGSPGSYRGSAGLFGGRFSPNDSPADLDLEQTRIKYASYKNSYFSGIAVNGLSYDPVTKSLLVLFENNLNSYLVRIDPCKNEKIKQDAFYFGRLNLQNPGPFALYNNDIFFLARSVSSKDGEIILKFTIRRVIECEEKSFLNSRGSFLEECSVQVAEVCEQKIPVRGNGQYLDEWILEQTERYAQTVGSKLLVMERNNQLYFLVQVANPAYDSGQSNKYSMDLYVAMEGSKGKRLYSSNEGTKWASYIINNLGDISYKDGLLCWATFEKIFCDEFSGVENTLSPVEIVRPGEARQVCNVSDNFVEYTDIVTGIELVSTTNDRLGIIFGCWGSWTGNGGAGYVSCRKNGSAKSLQPIADKRGKILAGNLVAIDPCVAH